MSTETTESTTTTAAETTAQAQADVISMSTKEFEALVSGRIGKAIAQAERKLRAELGGATPETAAELEQLRKEKAERVRLEAERKGEYEKAKESIAQSVREPLEAQLKTEREAAEKLRAKLTRQASEDKLVAAAAAAEAIAPKQVMALLQGYIKLDEDFEPFVVDDAGVPRHVAGKPMTIDQLTQEFLKSNPHMVKPVGGTGSGSTGGKSRSTGEPDTRALAEKELADLESQYRQTRNADLLPQIGKASAKVRAAKVANAV